MTALLTVVAMAAPVAGLAWLARRVRLRGVSGGYSLMGPFDELWHPAAVAARLEVQEQEERQEAAPAPGDRPFRLGLHDVDDRRRPSRTRPAGRSERDG